MRKINLLFIRFYGDNIIYFHNLKELWIRHRSRREIDGVNENNVKEIHQNIKEAELNSTNNLDSGLYNTRHMVFLLFLLLLVDCWLNKGKSSMIQHFAYHNIYFQWKYLSIIFDGFIVETIAHRYNGIMLFIPKNDCRGFISNS